MNQNGLNLKAGETVVVRGESEILATLDKDGTLDGILFMPEMSRYCGKRLTVYRRADKVCVDPGVFCIRRLKDTVLLEGAMCDGSAHDGCARMCRIFWKEAWLRRVDHVEPSEMLKPPQEQEYNLMSIPAIITRDKSYSCQSTNLFHATEPLGVLDLRQYVRDVTSGNFAIMQVVKALYIVLYNKVKRIFGGVEFGGEIGAAISTPMISLNLHPGELVEVKTRQQIIPTLDSLGRNRGLTIDHEMMRHAGRQFRVLRRVDRIILESNGKMKEIRNTVLLDNVTCEGLCRRACSRGCYPMWREAWLKRVESPARDVQEDKQ